MAVLKKQHCHLWTKACDFLKGKKNERVHQNFLNDSQAGEVVFQFGMCPATTLLCPQPNRIVFFTRTLAEPTGDAQVLVVLPNTIDSTTVRRTKWTIFLDFLGGKMNGVLGSTDFNQGCGLTETSHMTTGVSGTR